MSRCEEVKPLRRSEYRSSRCACAWWLHLAAGRLDSTRSAEGAAVDTVESVHGRRALDALCLCCVEIRSLQWIAVQKATGYSKGRTA